MSMRIHNITIADRINEYRLKNNLSQGRFGSILGVSAQAVYKWERELCYPDIVLLPELARVLGCRVDDFFE